MDYLEIASVPYDEPCIQVGHEYYSKYARLECKAFARQIVRTLGEPPSGASLVIKRNSHDFGSYHEVAVKFDDSNDEATDYAFKVESEAPSSWDEEAFLDLGADYFDCVKWKGDN